MVSKPAAVSASRVGTLMPISSALALNCAVDSIKRHGNKWEIMKSLQKWTFARVTWRMQPETNHESSGKFSEKQSCCTHSRRSRSLNTPCSHGENCHMSILHMTITSRGQSCTSNFKLDHVWRACKDRKHIDVLSGIMSRKVFIHMPRSNKRVKFQKSHHAQI